MKKLFVTSLKYLKAVLMEHDCVIPSITDYITLIRLQPCDHGNSLYQTYQSNRLFCQLTKVPSLKCPFFSEWVSLNIRCQSYHRVTLPSSRHCPLSCFFNIFQKLRFRFSQNSPHSRMLMAPWSLCNLERHFQQKLVNKKIL